MAMLFSLVCGGAFFCGVIKVLRKYYLRDRRVDVEVMVVAVMLGASIFSFTVQFIWLGIPKISVGFWWPFAVTAFLNIGIQYWSVKALKLEDASIVASLQGVTPLFVIATSWFLLREFPTSYGLLGIGFIVLGVYILNLKGLDVRLPMNLRRIIPQRLHQRIVFFGAPWFRLFSSKGACLALFTALLGSIALNFDKMTVLNSNPMILTGGVFLVAAISIYSGSMISGQWKGLNKSCFWPLFGIGLFLGLANVLMNSGYFYGIVPYVGSLKRTQILWTAIFASIFLGEKHTILRLGAAAVIIAGVILIAF